jgi:non-specific serine/threonine protein kinase
MFGIYLTRLIGRGRERAAVRERLLEPHVRLLTLVGPPGIGKTRLGLAVADQLAAEVSAGAGPASVEEIAFVPLAAVREQALIPSAIAESLGIGETGRQGVKDAVRAILRERPFLLVVDNLEHLPDAGSLVAELLGACPRMKVLATSRAPLLGRVQ